jgi:hypothetical protein
VKNFKGISEYKDRYISEKMVKDCFEWKNKTVDELQALIMDL